MLASVHKRRGFPSCFLCGCLSCDDTRPFPSYLGAMLSQRQPGTMQSRVPDGKCVSLTLGDGTAPLGDTVSAISNVHGSWSGLTPYNPDSAVSYADSWGSSVESGARSRITHADFFSSSPRCLPCRSDTVSWSESRHLIRCTQLTNCEEASFLKMCMR